VYWNKFIQFVATIRPALEFVAIVATPIGVFWGLHTYQRSVRLEKAKWMKELYEKFYERTELKGMRDILDGDDTQKISEMVKSEDTHFTDYLNFFEFLGYLSESKQIGRNEILGMFDYYLRNLRDQPEVAGYIKRPDKGFEKLRALLSQVK
jgi:hypothetical protein